MASPLGDLTELVDDLFLGGKTALVMLGKDLLIADGHRENPAASPDDATLDVKGLFDLGRQTGGSR